MFINIHTLTHYPAGVHNRDFQGHMKTIAIGDSVRTRLSSAYVKRNWRDAKEPWSISQALPTSERSRAVFVEMIAKPLAEAGHDPVLVASATLPWIFAVCGQSENAKKKDYSVDPRQPYEHLYRQEAVLMTAAEIAYITDRIKAALEIGGTAEEVFEAASADTAKNRANIQALTNNISIETVLMGRFTSGDAAARAEASLSVAHQFTTHRHQATRDALANIDTLLTPQTGAAAGLSEAVIAAGCFYGYSCLSVPLMVSNLTGCEMRDWESHVTPDAVDLIGRVINTIYLTSPRSGGGNSAPNTKPGFMLVEFGPSHQMSYADAFEVACEEATVTAAARRLTQEITERDEMYGSMPATRIFAAKDRDLEIPGAERSSITGMIAKIAAALPANTGNVIDFPAPKSAATPKAAKVKKAGRK